MASFQPRDENFRARVTRSFAAQAAMHALGISLARLAPGEVELHLEYRRELTQQHGFIHAGVLATALDSACGYAAFSLMPAEAEVLTVEFKINLLSPARGDEFHCIGAVIKPGRTLTLARGDAWAVQDGKRKLVAQMSATLMSIVGRDDVRG